MVQQANLSSPNRTRPAATLRGRNAQRATLASASAVALLLVVSGCAVSRDGVQFVRPGMPNSSPAIAQASADAPADFRYDPPPPAGDSAAWWRTFADPVLTTLVDEALTESLSVQQAQLRISEARNLGRATVAGFAPRLSVGADTTTTIANSGPDLRDYNNNVVNSQTTLNTGARASWEVPLFGRLGSSLAGARANERNAEIGLEAAKIALIGDMASAYVNLRTAQVRVAYVQDDIARAERLVRIANDRLRVGLVSRADAAFAEAQLAGLQAQLPDANLAVQNALNAITILRGAMPGSLDVTLAAPANVMDYQLGYATPDVSAVPADLLRRRPDVLQAEQQALLQAAAVGISRASFYPSLSIGGVIGVLSGLSGNPLAENIGRTTATSGISLPLFDFGQRQADLAVQNTRYQQSLLAYRGTVLNAVREGQLALASYSEGRARAQAALAAEAAAKTRYDATEVSFRAGLLSLKELTEAQTAMAQARQSRLSAQLALSDSSVGLYRAFAGSPGIN